MHASWIVDGHCDSLGDLSRGRRTLKEPLDGGHWDIIRAKQGGVGLQFLAAFIESEYKPDRASWRGLELIERALRFADDNSECVNLVLSKKDLEFLDINNKVGLLLSVEGGEILGESIFMLDLIFRLGVRALGLTWNQRNAIADGVGERNTGSRLTNFGQRVIERMNELGMVIDVSHLNEAGFWHVLELSKQPFIASHSCAKALCFHPRNLSDKQLKAIARKGGVVGVNFLPAFLVDSGLAKRQDVVRHICHIAEVAGVETVGLGSDFDGIENTPEGLESVELYPELLEDLIKAGFSQRDLNKICHENFVKLLLTVLK